MGTIPSGTNGTITTGDPRAEVVAILIEARRRIEKPENWLPRLSERYEEKDGKFCAARAIWSQNDGKSYEPGHRLAEGAYRALAEAMGKLSVPKFNDAHTHAEVLAAFDRAIASFSRRCSMQHIRIQGNEVKELSVNETPKCQKCGSPSDGLHSCPYQSEINDDCNPGYCNCCQACEQECSDDI